MLTVYKKENCYKFNGVWFDSFSEELLDALENAEPDNPNIQFEIKNMREEIYEVGLWVKRSGL